MRAMRLAGRTLVDVGAEYGLSRQRVSQILGPTPPVDGRKGFASLPPERRREISAKGGSAAQAAGRVPHFDSETGRAANAKMSRWPDGRMRCVADEKAAE
jgi:hypothetical protein